VHHTGRDYFFGHILCPILNARILGQLPNFVG
jgi:hypothetical protein